MTHPRALRAPKKGTDTTSQQESYADATVSSIARKPKKGQIPQANKNHMQMRPCRSSRAPKKGRLPGEREYPARMRPSCAVRYSQNSRNPHSIGTHLQLRRLVHPFWMNEATNKPPRRPAFFSEPIAVAVQSSLSTTIHHTMSSFSPPCYHNFRQCFLPMLVCHPKATRGSVVLAHARPKMRIGGCRG